MNVLKGVFIASGLVIAQGLWAQDSSVSNTAPPAAATQLPAQGTTIAPPAVAPAPKTYTVPSGTKVLLSLKSAVNTKTARVGDGVYLVSTFPVVVGNRVVIPPGVYVQGVVDRVQRAGHVKGRASVGMHFTSMIFPNGSVVEIPGVVDSLPGSSGPKVKDEEGTVEQSSNKGRDAATAAGTAMEGAAIGSIAGVASGSPGAGALYGGLAGAAVGGLITLFTRGDDVNIEQGTNVEMVLQRPLMVEDSNLQGNSPGFQPAPASGQPQPMEKPKRRTSILCPLGGLGCN
jgi:DNA/RNA endonuclease YhcR with UshA esterase domain